MVLSESVLFVTTNFTITLNGGYNLYNIDATSATLNIALPDISTTDGFILKFYRRDTSLNSVAINSFGGQLINGFAQFFMGVNSYFSIVSLSGNWYGSASSLGNGINLTASSLTSEPNDD